MCLLPCAPNTDQDWINTEEGGLIDDKMKVNPHQ